MLVEYLAMKRFQPSAERTARSAIATIAVIVAALGQPAFGQVARYGENSAYTYRLEREIDEQIGTINELQQEFFNDGIQVPLLFLPEAEGVNAAEKIWNACREISHGIHGMQAPNVAQKIQEYRTIRRNLAWEFSALRQHSTPAEANRFFNAPLVNAYIRDTRLLQNQAETTRQRCSAHPTPPRQTYCAPPTHSWPGPGGEQEMTRQTQEYADCQLRSGQAGRTRQ